MVGVVEIIDPIFEQMRSEDVELDSLNRGGVGKNGPARILDTVRFQVVEAQIDSIHAAVVAALDADRDRGFSSFQVTVVEEFD